MADIDPNVKEDPYAYQAHLGFDIAGWDTDYCRVEQPLLPHLMNRYGIPHGGVYASLLDTAMGFSGCYTGDPDNRRLGMTLNLSVNYLGRPKGKVLICEGMRVGGGAKTFFAEGILKDETGEIIAKATGVFRYRS